MKLKCRASFEWKTGRFLQTPTWISGGLKLFETITAIVAFSMTINKTSFLDEAGLFYLYIGF